MATSRAGFCRVCKIGTLDVEGLCVLCGAPSVPLSKPRHLVGTLLEAATSLPAIALYAVLLTGAATLAVWRYLGPDRAMAAVRVGPLSGGLSGGAVAVLLLAPIVLALVVMIVLFLLGRRGGRHQRARNAA